MPTDSLLDFESIPVIDNQTTLEPMKIQASLDVHKQIASRPCSRNRYSLRNQRQAEPAGLPLNDIQSLLKEVRSDLANRQFSAWRRPGIAGQGALASTSAGDSNANAPADV